MKRLFFLPAIAVLLAVGCNKTTLTAQNPPGSQQPTHSIEGEKTGSEFLKNLGGAAPGGYKWVYRYDWDGIVLSKILTNVNGQDTPIEPAVLTKFQNMKLPKEYHWTMGQTNLPEEGGMVVTRLGISNPFACPYGKNDGEQECTNPK